jgi:hypothetical protein
LSDVPDSCRWALNASMLFWIRNDIGGTFLSLRARDETRS